VPCPASHTQTRRSDHDTYTTQNRVNITTENKLLQYRWPDAASLQPVTPQLELEVEVKKSAGMILPSSLLPFPCKQAPLNPAKRFGERCKLPQWGLGQSPSRSQISCVLALKYDSGVNNINDFLENPLSKFRAGIPVYDSSRKGSNGGVIFTRPGKSRHTVSYRPKSSPHLHPEAVNTHTHTHTRSHLTALCPCPGLPG